MKINELTNQRVVVSAHTITVKDENDKTKGMVRNVDNLYAIQPSKQFQYASQLGKANVDRAVYMKYLSKILIVDGKLYYLVDTSTLEIEKRLGNTKLEDDIKELSKGIEVIYCKKVYYTNKR